MTQTLAEPRTARPHTANAWPPARVVAELPGSLPMGGVVPATPVHAFAQTPAALTLDASGDALRPAKRQDIALGGLLAFTIDPVLTAQECAALIAAGEHFGFREEAPGIATPPGMRMNKTVHWVADDALFGPLFQRMTRLLPAQIDGRPLLPLLSHRLNMYRYDDGDVFNIHIDGDWPGFGLDATRTQMLQWPQGRSCLTMLAYLNDGVQGGATRLYRPDGSHVEVTPRQGAALFFRHGFGPFSVRHVGCQVHGPVPKYVARINVMYGAPSSVGG